MTEDWDFELEDMASIADPPGSVRANIVFLHGRNEIGPKTQLDPWEARAVEAGLRIVFPYYGPWGWMTPPRARLLDDIVSKLHRRDAEAPPLIIAGDSMGGQAALLYAGMTYHQPVGVCVLCPVCDVPACYRDSPDARRSLVNGLWGEGYTLEDALLKASPLDWATRLPRVPYQFIHHVGDEVVPKAKHSDPMVATMRESGHEVEYLEVEGAHCEPLDAENEARRQAFFLRVTA